MAALFQDHKVLHSRYGLSKVEAPGSNKSTPSAILGTLASKLQIRTSSLTIAHVDAGLPWLSFTRRPALPTAIRWAVDDKRKFADLVQHLKDFNDDLEALTTELNVLQCQRDLIREEVGSIIDVEELANIETARMGVRDPVADAASLRLFQIQENNNNALGMRPMLTKYYWGRLPSTPTIKPGSSWISRLSLLATLIPERICPIKSYIACRWLVVDEYSPLGDPSPLHLSGKRPLHSVRSYLEQNSHLKFLVFKEYTCSHNTNSARMTEATQSCVYLVSDALCSTLNSLNLEAEPPVFCPAMELRSPYEWFFNNREMLDEKRPLQLARGRDARSMKAAELLLEYTQSCMVHTYQEIEHSRTGSKMVRWDHLPLIFPPGGVVIERHSDGEDDDRAFPLNQYIIDATTYEQLHQPRSISRQYKALRFKIDDSEDSEKDMTALELDMAEMELEERIRETEEESREHDDMENCEADGDISPKRRRFFTCQPHVIRGFHLRDHVWRNLLVDRVRWVDEKWGPSQDMVVGEPKKIFLERLLARTRKPGPNVPRNGWLIPAKVVMAVRGPGANEAVDAVSLIAKRALYRVRISTESEAGSAEGIFRQTASLASEWGCIVLIEDLLGTYRSRRRPLETLNATVAPLLRFLDTFGGIVIFSLPDEDLEVDPRVEERVCATLYFEYEVASPENRKALWRQSVKAEGKSDPKTEFYLDRLAGYELSWDSIRSLAVAVPRDVSIRPYRQSIDWGLLLKLAAKKAQKGSELDVTTDNYAIFGE
ncbi:hypothetical protein C8A00DRAFT_30467 [Chaetomidium leptoderma]|uniref:Prion-inhibition and propagation HeLo domain-containing protein n=1 Tax=Chaetomidium leptoderma TaxID=669021 RepID=A0AAN6VS34_9PEZI|nr:hypothetical protein C8A00DRAFT_30467 [Chaetomidium leptoderma]